MNNAETERIDRITRSLYDLLEGRTPEPIDTEGQEDDEIRQLGGFVNRLAAELDLATRFATDLSRGDLSTEGKSSLALCGCIKSLQASLKHLKWQANRIAEGDFTQTVSFLGDFSDAFNWMVKKLGDHNREMEREIAERKEAQRAAEESSMAKARFLAHMSHEIRTPMNGVLGMLDLLKSTRLDEEQGHYASVAHESAHVLLNLLNDILDFSKMEAGKLQIQIAEMNVADEVNRVIALFSLQARGKGLNLESRCDGHIPDIVRGDPVRLRQILVNLVGNAVKFTEKGGITVRAARSEETCAGVVVRFEVTDTGIGIEPGIGEKIFDPFVQSDTSTTRKCGGTGLGLAICRDLVKSMGGTIGVESTLMLGSTFWFTMPFLTLDEYSEAAHGERPSGIGPVVAPHEGTGEENRPERASQRPEAARVRQFTVLLAEDNPVNQQVALAMLRRAGCTVDVAKNGREAVDAFFGSSYDIVFMDCQMPVVDGYEASRFIRAREKSEGRQATPIVALTANAMEGDREKCIAAGMSDYLPKPFGRAELAAMLERWAGG